MPWKMLTAGPRVAGPDPKDCLTFPSAAKQIASAISSPVAGIVLTIRFVTGRPGFFVISLVYIPWHFLYFRPLPHGHGSLRPTFGLRFL